MAKFERRCIGSEGKECKTKAAASMKMEDVQLVEGMRLVPLVS